MKSRLNIASRVWVLTLVAALLTTPGWAQQRGPSTPEERTKAVRIARQLEADPLSKELRDGREWLLRWLIEIPDITVSVCGGLLGPVVGSKKNYSSEILTQMIFSEAAFIIENPDRAKDQVGVHQAGVEGALRAYESILRTNPKARWLFLDELIAKRDKGALADYVRAA